MQCSSLLCEPDFLKRELKKQRRKQSNGESAHRSRLRKQVKFGLVYNCNTNNKMQSHQESEKLDSLD
nr:hypothetical protein [Tanacetum cinerariifolium]